MVEDPIDLELVNTPLRREVKWVSPSGTPITAFCRPFKGVFKGVEYDCPTPPRKTFKNHPSCKQFVNFISETLSQRLKTGAVKVWGKVGSSTSSTSDHCGAIQTQIVHRCTLS